MEQDHDAGKRDSSEVSWNMDIDLMMKHRITRDANLRSLLGSRSSNIVRKPAAKISQDQPMDGSKSPNSGTLSQGQAGPPLAWVAGCTMYLFHGVVLTDEDRVEKTNESNGGL